jgi:omega-6 fatty acid desaturase (delta-12 desaturase)
MYGTAQIFRALRHTLDARFPKRQPLDALGGRRRTPSSYPEGALNASSIQLLKEQKRALSRRYTRPSDLTGLTQILTTLGPLCGLWWLAAEGGLTSRWLTVVAVPGMCLFTLRVFALMHECGHGSLFRTSRLNRAFGFLLGVMAGMPQYVWSQHHHYHHTHNGNWDKYRGPYTTLSVDEYAAMTAAQKRLYRCKCSILLAPVVGFVYLLFNPRYTWLKGSIAFVSHVARKKIARPDLSMKAHAASFRTRYWQSPREYWHMFWNNLVLLSAWALLCWACGTGPFFLIYVISLSLAGGAGVVLFTVQHNFEHAYASDGEHWEYDRGAIDGTSFLILPGYLNWFTANIGYHHIHHLFPGIPNYCLVECHNKYQHLFADVRRLGLSDIRRALKCILWDARARRIITIAEHRRLQRQSGPCSHGCSGDPGTV